MKACGIFLSGGAAGGKREGNSAGKKRRNVTFRGKTEVPASLQKGRRRGGIKPHFSVRYVCGMIRDRYIKDRRRSHKIKKSTLALPISEQLCPSFEGRRRVETSLFRIKHKYQPIVAISVFK